MIKCKSVFFLFLHPLWFISFLDFIYSPLPAPLAPLTAFSSSANQPFQTDTPSLPSHIVVTKHKLLSRICAFILFTNLDLCPPSEEQFDHKHRAVRVSMSRRGVPIFKASCLDNLFISAVGLFFVISWYLLGTRARS